MTTKKGGSGGGGSIPPPPARRPDAGAPAPPPQPKRPQLRPISGAKAPAIRPLTRPQAPPPKPPGAAPSEKLPSLASQPDEDDATNVMPRAFSLDVPPPAFKGTLRSPTESQRTPAPAVKPAAGRPARPNIDLVPKTQRAPAERTAVMPNAPVRAPAPLPSARPGRGPTLQSPTAAPRAAPTARAGSGAPPPHFPVPSSPPKASVPPPPQSSRPRGPGPSIARSSKQPPRKHDTAIPSTRPSEQAVLQESLQTVTSPGPVGGRSPSRAPTQPLLQQEPPPITFGTPSTQPLPPMAQHHQQHQHQQQHHDETLAMVRGNWTPSAPPIAMGPAVQRPLSAAPPANVRTRPPSVAPPPHFATPTRPPVVGRTETPGVVGFVLFAAPLALAMAIIAALALL